MSSTTIQILTTPYLLYTASVLSFSLLLLIKSYVRKNGPIPIFRSIIKYNSRVYALASFIYFLAILVSSPSHQNLRLHNLVCAPPPKTTYENTLRYLYHASKFYEYIDIFNVLAVGGVVNRHFGFHHFTTPYLTYARVICHPVGWKVFATFNTFHHALMYAYFGGAEVFSDVLPWTGTLQLVIGIAVEMYQSFGGCGGNDGLWTNILAGVLLATYAVLFAEDLGGRGKHDDGEMGKKVD